MISDKIKMLRENKNLTQSDLAKQLGITRSSVNAWEMGISVPSTQYIVELAQIFDISTDYLLNGLNEKQIKIISNLINYFKNEKQ